jgi:methylamine utilization protein MauE
MWQIMAGPYLAAAALLVVAGVPKVVDPMPLVRALRSAGLPAGRAPVRAFALAEVVVGAAALAAPGRGLAVLVAAAYLVFTAFVALALARGGVLASCGCFGKADTPPTRSHLAVTTALAGAAAALAVSPPGGPVWTADTLTRPATSVLLGFAALLAVLSHAVMAVLPLATPAAARSAATTPRRG